MNPIMGSLHLSACSRSIIGKNGNVFGRLFISGGSRW